jgi:UPF0755 protein
LAVVVGLIVTTIAGILIWLNLGLSVRQGHAELLVEPGMTPREVARGWVNVGVQAPEWALLAWFRLSGDDRRIRAGSYEVTAGTSPRELLRKMVEGDETLGSLRVGEGWTFRQLREALAQQADLRQETASWSDGQIMQALGLPELHPEGRFFPDTYLFSRGVSDLSVLRMAHQRMERRLALAWSERPSGSLLKSPTELLILASIVEKETGLPSDRAQVSGVFHNRLRLGMPLQTDPTVIYGLGPAFDGNLRKADLQRDNPWNTYTRVGLPPTPIALPGDAALRAAAKPERTSALYFVARGDGSSQFSATLAEHNEAVRRFQLAGRSRKAP